MIVKTRANAVYSSLVAFLFYFYFYFYLFLYLYFYLYFYFESRTNVLIFAIVYSESNASGQVLNAELIK